MEKIVTESLCKRRIIAVIMVLSMYLCGCAGSARTKEMQDFPIGASQRVNIGGDNILLYDRGSGSLISAGRLEVE